MSASNAPSLKAQFEDDYAAPEPTIRHDAAAPSFTSCDDHSCN